MTCDRYFELLSAQLDGGLTGEEERELETHLARCPGCRELREQLTALQAGFHELEDIPAPEGFAQGVMDRIRAERPKKVIPLFKRPQLKALAGLAACFVLVVGLYGAAQRAAKDEESMLKTRSFIQDTQEEGDGPRVNADLVDPELEDTPQIAAYAASEPAPCDGVKQVDGLDVEPVEGLPAERLPDSAILVLERMPQGAAELIVPETTVTYAPATGEEGYCWTGHSGEPEVLAQIERLAQEQGITAERSSTPAEELMYDLVILQVND